MNESMRAPNRNLGVRLILTMNTSTTITLTGDDILRFSIDEGADGALLPGAALSARCRIAIRSDGQWWQDAAPLTGATAQLFLICGEEELPCGVFILDEISGSEQDGEIILSGSDSIATELGYDFYDTLSYPATLSQVWAHLISQTRYAWSGALPNGDAIIDTRPDWGEATLRRAAGWIAQAAGCFVRVDRMGNLEMVPCLGGEAEDITPDDYFTLTDGLMSYGPVKNLQVILPEDATFTAQNGLGELVSVQGNPLFIPGAAHLHPLAQGMLDEIDGLTLARAEFAWRGDPAVSVGSRIRIENLSGDRIECAVTRQTLTFDGGFTARCACETPQDKSGGVVRAITPEGGVNAAALVGRVNGGLLAAGSVGEAAIAAGSVTAEKIAAGAIDAHAISAVTAEFSRLTAGNIGASSLYASLAHVMSLAAGSIAAGRIDADQLAAELARIVSLQVGAGEFDFAQVENLLSAAMILEKGQMDSVQIVNLAVTSANLLNATIGNLILKGGDGKYYRIFIGADGGIRTEQTTVTDGEISAGQTGSGQQIVETTANIENLNATSLTASGAIIAGILTDSLTAGRITAGEALLASATIPALYATTLKAIGDTIDISANSAVTIIAGNADNAQKTAEAAQSAAGSAQDTADSARETANATKSTLQRWFTFDNEQGLVIQKPAYVDEEGVSHAASIWSTVTDETGYHIKRADLPGYVGSFARDSLTVQGISVGEIVAKKTAKGGWAWVEA